MATQLSSFVASGPRASAIPPMQLPRKQQLRAITRPLIEQSAPLSAFFNRRGPASTFTPPDVPRIEETSRFERLSNILRLVPKGDPLRSISSSRGSLKSFALFKSAGESAFTPPDCPPFENEKGVQLGTRITNMVETVKSAKAFQETSQLAAQNLEKMQAARTAVMSILNNFTEKKVDETAMKTAPLAEFDEDLYAPEAAINEDVIAAIRAEREREAEEGKLQQIRMRIFGK